jgi:hypothetical protein
VAPSGGDPDEGMDDTAGVVGDEIDTDPFGDDIEDSGSRFEDLTDEDEDDGE